MSLLDDASIVVVPSGYKAGTVYSVKPTDGSGDLDFTRSLDTATRVGSDGLIEKVRTNLLPSSNDISIASTYWNPNSGGTTTQNAAVAPDGTTTAALITPDGLGAFSGVKAVSTITLAAVPHTFSVFLRTNSGTASVTILVLDAASTFHQVVVTATTTYTRFSVTFTPAAGAAGAFITSSGAVAWLAWGAQLESSDIATNLIPTTTAAVSVGMLANVPRLDYSGGGCPKLLLEPQRTNLAKFSEQINNAAFWALANSGTITANSTISPDGFQNADILNAGAASSQVQGAIVGTSGAVYTVSIYVKRITGTGNVFLRAVENADTLISVTSEWQRFTATVTSTTTTIRIGIKLGTSGDAVAIYGAQLEEASYATSYIPTLGAAVTRSVDEASKTGISDLIGQTEGTLFLEVDVSTLQGAVARAFIDIGAASNRVFIGFTGLASNTIRLQIDTSVGQRVDFRGVVTSTGTLKVAAAYKDGDCALFINGVAGTQIANNSISFSTISDLFLGQTITGSALLSDGINQALVFPTRLTNTQLEELTTI